MSIKKIFIVLVTIVACVILGAFLLNTLMPNTVSTLIDSVEDQIFKATSLSFDFNNNGHTGQVNSTYTGDNTDNTVTGQTGSNVEGFN